jgi:hypothetical protein
MSKSQDEGFKKTLRRMLCTPPKPLKSMTPKRKKAQSEGKKKPGK